jgi:Xaa-Pro aminopeptidase
VVCAFKEPTDLEQKLMDSELRALDEVRARAKPGTTLTDLEETFIGVILEDGWKLGEPAWHFSFHGQGMDGIEWPFYTPMNVGNEDTSLEAGMVFSYHPHRTTVPTAGHPPKIFDAFVITDDGAKTLSTDWDFRWRIMT